MDKKNSSQSSVKASLGIRKREQIKRSSKVMFFWVAGASVIVSFSVVGSIFLIKQFIFNSAVLLKKNETATILQANLSAAQGLNESVEKLRANRAIASVPSIATKGNNLDKILDALPYEQDALGLGSSLQTTLLTEGSIDSLTIDTGQGDFSLTDAEGVTFEAPEGADYIGFSFEVVGSEKDIKDIIDKLNRSIRPMKIIDVEMQPGEDRTIEMNVRAITFYAPKTTYKVGEETIKP